MSKTTRRAAEMLAEIAQDLVDDSGSETDLDLPEPASFLDASPSTTQQKREIVLAPETPPSLLPQETDKELLLLPSINAVYSVKSTPRSRKSDGDDTPLIANASSSRSLNEQLEQQKRKQPSKSHRGSGTRAAETESPGRSTRQRTTRMALDAMKADAPEPTPRKRSKRAAKQPTASSSTRSILTTGLSDAQLKRIQKSIGPKLDLTIYQTVAPLLASHTCTHLVAATAGKSKRASRTFKYLVGLVLGAQMVTSGWLFDSVKAGRWLDEGSYAIEGDTALPQHCLSSSQKLKGLFDKYKLYVCCEGGSAYSRDELVGLVKAAGATVVESLDGLPAADEQQLEQQHAAKKRKVLTQGSMAKDVAKVPAKYRYLFELPTHTSRPIVLIDSSQLDGTPRSSATLSNLVKTAGTQLPYRTTSWLFDCLSACQIC
ncbi:hypothetical protein EV183_001610 [Coemansia sp. RSA 2336]|nr:hypothetical protein EV183_001610 [Coemansia sp. RSA 2336]